MLKKILKINILTVLLITEILSNISESAHVREKLPEQQNSIEWGAQMAEDYIRLVEWQDIVKQFIFTELVEKYKCEGEDSFQLMDTCRIQNLNGDSCELYLIQYNDRMHMKKEGTWGYYYSGILVNYDQNRSEVLFKVEKDYGLASLGDEFYDIQTADLDGNGEEDIILLLGEHRRQGAEYYIPDIYGLLGFQNKGKFQFVNCHEEKWLDEILYQLYKDEYDNRNIQNILMDLKGHFNNTNSDEVFDNKKTVEEYIQKKEENIEKKINQRSLFISREVLWEQLFVNEDNQIQKIRIFVENGEKGFAPIKQISVYVYDYQTEEAEKQIVPSIYGDICDEYGLLTEIELEELTYEDQNEDGEKDIALTVVFSNEKKQSKYRIIYFRGNCPGNELKIFTKVTATEVKDS